MPGFSFRPVREEMEAFRRRVENARVWWVEFERPVERVFCDKGQQATVYAVDGCVAWTGMEDRHHPRLRPTDRDDVALCEYGIPIERVAVTHEWMPCWMRLVRANGLHGRYREAGTDRWYEF